MSRPTSKRIGYKANYDTIIHRYKGRNYKCYAVPKAYWDMIMRNTERDKMEYNILQLERKLQNANAQVAYYKRSLKGRIDAKVKEADKLIRVLTN